MFTFFMKRDIKNFNPRVIPQTQAKKDVLELSKSAVEQYIESTVDDFNERGENCDTYYQNYCMFARSHGFGVMSINTFGKEAKEYLKKNRVRINGRLENRYFLIEEYKQRVLDNNKVDIDFDAEDAQALCDWDIVPNAKHKVEDAKNAEVNV